MQAQVKKLSDYNPTILSVKRRCALANDLCTILDDFREFNIEPITLYKRIDGHTLTRAVLKLNQYSLTPYEVMLLPTHRAVANLHHLTPKEGVSFFTAVRETAESLQTIVGNNAALYIGINQHLDISQDVPKKIEREFDQVDARVQTIDQLHAHVECELPSAIVETSFRQLSKQNQLEIRDPYTFIAAELMQKEFMREKEKGNSVWGNIWIQSIQFPLGLNVEIPSGLSSLSSRAFFDSLLALHHRYIAIYHNCINCLVDKTRLDEFGFPTPYSLEERLSCIEQFITNTSKMSRHSQLLLRMTARGIQLFGNVPPEYTLVKGPAYTIHLYEKAQGKLVLNWQPRIVSRGNLLSARGILRQQKVPTVGRLVLASQNAHTAIYEQVKKQTISQATIRKGERIQNYVPRLDSRLLDETIAYTKPQLKYFCNSNEQIQLIRSLLDGSFEDLKKYTDDPVLLPNHKLAVEDYIANVVKSSLFSKDICLKHSDGLMSIDEEQQRKQLTQFIQERCNLFPNKWGVTQEHLSLQAKNNVVYDKQGNIVYSEKEIWTQVDKFGKQIVPSLQKQGINILAFYGRPKYANSVSYLLTSHHKNIKCLSDIDDLIATRVVVNTLQDVENVMSHIETFFGCDILRKWNLFVTPLAHSPLFRACFYYFQVSDYNLVELQVCTKYEALIAPIDHMLAFKPNIDLLGHHVEELLFIPKEQVRTEHLKLLSAYPIQSIKKRVQSEEWVQYASQRPELLEDIPQIMNLVYSTAK